jgi:hypothetical protein
MSSRSAFALSITMVLGVSSASYAQTALPIGTPQRGKVTADAPAEYTIAAKTAGVLVVALQGEGDLALQVTDADGQTLPEGSADRDLHGSEGKELMSMLVPEPGNYKVRVRLQGGSASTFQINGSWLSFPPFAQASTDPDRRPSQANAAQIGKAFEDSLNAPAGDAWDWYEMKVTEPGTLVVVTRPVGESDTDLVLEVFTGTDFSRPAGRSDQDLQGSKSNESVTLNVEAGQSVHVRVAGAFSSANGKYRLSSNLVP